MQQSPAAHRGVPFFRSQAPYRAPPRFQEPPGLPRGDSLRSVESHRASALRPLKQSFTANIVRYAIPNNLFELQGKCAQRVRHDIKRVEGACLFSYYWRRRLAGVASEGVYML